MSNDDQPDRLAPRHPVRVVASRTGLSPHVLRAWERRYGVVSPTRSEGGQRLYSDLDLERLTLLHGLTAEGTPISQVAQLPLEQLRRLALARPVPPPLNGNGDAAASREHALEAAQALDPDRLRRLLQRGTVTLGVPVLLEEVVGPLLVEIGEQWHTGRMTIAQEHFATSVVRRMLSWILEMSEPEADAPVLVVATPRHQIHEGGALLCAAAAAGAGWRVLYLGPDLPAAEIAQATRRSEARAVALSLAYPKDDPVTAGEIQTLATGLPAGTPLLVGGAAASSYAEALERSGAQLVPDLASLRGVLHRLAPVPHP